MEQSLFPHPTPVNVRAGLPESGAGDPDVAFDQDSSGRAQLHAGNARAQEAEPARFGLVFRIFIPNILPVMKRIPVRGFLAAAVALVLPACAELETAGRTASTAARRAGEAVRSALPLPPQGGTWGNEDVPGRARIVVDLSEQKAYFYKGKNLVGESTVSTGMKGFSTPPGSYTVLQKDRDHYSSAFGDYVDDSGNVVKSNIDVRKDRKPRGAHFDAARMPYFMRFRGGYGMHAGYVPPYRASHGCIRLPTDMARRFFNAAREGTPVIVKE